MPLLRSRLPATPEVVLEARKGSGQYLLWDAEFTASSSMIVCLWVCGIDVKDGLVAKLEVSSRNGEVRLVLVGLKFKDTRQKMLMGTWRVTEAPSFRTWLSTPTGRKLVGIHSKMGMAFASKFNGTLVVKMFKLVKGMLSITGPTNTQKDGFGGYVAYKLHPKKVNCSKVIKHSHPHLASKSTILAPPCNCTSYTVNILCLQNRAYGTPWYAGQLQLPSGKGVCIRAKFKVNKMNVLVLRKDLSRINVCGSAWDRAHKCSIRVALVSGRGASTIRENPVRDSLGDVFRDFNALFQESLISAGIRVNKG
eukprot:1150406-Pelagomonas_calceolata.AAC.2